MVSSPRSPLPRLFAAFILASMLLMKMVFSPDFNLSSPGYFVVCVIILVLTILVLAFIFISNAIPSFPLYTPLIRDAFACTALCILSTANLLMDATEGFAIIPLPIFILDSAFLFLITLPLAIDLFFQHVADKCWWPPTPYCAYDPSQSGFEGLLMESGVQYIDMDDDKARAKLRSPVGDVGSPLVVHVHVEVCEGYI